MVTLALGASLVASAATAQTPPPAAPAQSPVAQAPAPGPQTLESYTYSPNGRRDPFVSLLTRGGEMRGGVRPEGVGGLLINDVTVRGIVQSQGQFVGMLSGPDKRTYIVHAKDRLFDGSITAITSDTIVFSQEVNDPLSLVKQREIRKTIRSLQGGK
jgi:Tfp pilus assembly protein PilP